MIGDITVSGLAFVQIYSDKDQGSLHREVSRGAQLPTEILIKHQQYVDSTSKRAGWRTLVAIDYYMTMTDGIISPLRLQLTYARPTDPLVTAAIETAMAAILVNLIHGTTNTSGLDLHSVILSTRSQ